MSKDIPVYFEFVNNEGVKERHKYTDTSMFVLTKKETTYIDLSSLIYIAIFCLNRKISLEVLVENIIELLKYIEQISKITDKKDFIYEMNATLEKALNEYKTLKEYVKGLEEEIDYYTDVVSWYEQHGLNVNSEDF